MTTANPEGLTTIPETWGFGASKNHMILLQIEERFHSGLAGIPRHAGPSATANSSSTRHVTSEWTRRNGTFRLKVSVPPNTTAEVRVPTRDHTVPEASKS